MLRKVPVLSTGLVELSIDSPQRLLASLSGRLEQRIYFEGEIMIEEGTAATEMFFIFSGVLEIHTKHHPEGNPNSKP
jgi:CRP-like cAMP-binding protein